MARKRKTKRKPDTRIAWFLLALGLVLFGLGAWAAFEGWRTLAWPRAKATIVDAKLRIQTSPARPTLHVRQPQPDEWASFIVHYTYTVGDTQYFSGRVEPYDFGMQNSAGARKMKERHPVGSKAPVAYDPADPALAYLEPGPSSISLMLMGIGVAVALLSLLARRMVRVGPGADDDEAPPKTPGPPVLDPEIAEYYRKPGEAQS